MDSSKRGRDHPAGKGHGKLTVSKINILNESSSFIFQTRYLNDPYTTGLITFYIILQLVTHNHI